jgi:hypothetical protein
MSIKSIVRIKSKKRLNNSKSHTVILSKKTNHPKKLKAMGLSPPKAIPEHPQTYPCKTLSLKSPNPKSIQMEKKGGISTKSQSQIFFSQYLLSNLLLP